MSVLGGKESLLCGLVWPGSWIVGGGVLENRVFLCSCSARLEGLSVPQVGLCPRRALQGVQRAPSVPAPEQPSQPLCRLPARWDDGLSHARIYSQKACAVRCVHRPLCLHGGAGRLMLGFVIRPSPNAFDILHRTFKT